MKRTFFDTLKRWILPAALVCSLGCVSNASAQTRQLLDAPVVDSYLQLKWNPTDKALKWQQDDRAPFRAFEPEMLFLTKRSIYVTYPLMNPLKVQVTASAVAADDPSYATISKLIKDILSVQSLVAPAAVPSAVSALGAVCPNAARDIASLANALAPPNTQPDELQRRISDWVTAIDDAYKSKKTGPEAIEAGRLKIIADLKDFKDNVEKAKAAWKLIVDCAANPATPATQAGAYNAARLADPSARIQQLAALAESAEKLADLLAKNYGKSEFWLGTNNADFVVSIELRPTYQKMQNVTVKAVSVDIKVDTQTKVISMSQETLGTATFSVRRYTALIPEIGVGAVFGSVKQPKYGTAKNSAGETIIARVPDASLSVNPSVLANFVCRCGPGVLAPMFQLGTSVSKELPAVLMGGGIRLFGLGSGDVAISGGAMAAWYKDLQKLKPGDVISGTKDIEADLGYIDRPKFGRYFAIQYKF